MTADTTAATAAGSYGVDAATVTAIEKSLLGLQTLSASDFNTALVSAVSIYVRNFLSVEKNNIFCDQGCFCQRRPFLDLKFSDRILRGVIFFFVIAYSFLGVSIVADRFMSSIEVITSMERTVTVKRPGLEPMKVKVRIWNDTVSNLTLMALVWEKNIVLLLELAVN
ncbi:unnamed protein product [Enterobius vermicularis]|uniref:Na_Ca_ex domain-containing protein n=1 Tax=Enterobius vermicularis TaxID=51028 RepID=A0A0N4VP42_ENTVE|nr:unnamed protein product [Enterobius vermicularis]